ncbi:hypothetical protein ABTX82_22015 [Streptomyces lavendulae]|uniref:hypothetical protein n=1 Tax=Streptomyces lavendulae TaxID=1914 RepID=UPI00331CC32E
MDTQPTYALSSRTPSWALDPYRFPGLEGLDVDEALLDGAAPPPTGPAESPQRPAR